MPFLIIQATLLPLPILVLHLLPQRMHRRPALRDAQPRLPLELRLRILQNLFRDQISVARVQEARDEDDCLCVERRWGRRGPEEPGVAGARVGAQNLQDLFEVRCRGGSGGGNCHAVFRLVLQESCVSVLVRNMGRCG